MVGVVGGGIWWDLVGGGMWCEVVWWDVVGGGIGVIYNFAIIFGPFLTAFSALCYRTRGVWHSLLDAHTHGLLIGACHPTLSLFHLFRPGMMYPGGYAMPPMGAMAAMTGGLDEARMQLCMQSCNGGAMSPVSPAAYSASLYEHQYQQQVSLTAISSRQGRLMSIGPRPGP